VTTSTFDPLLANNQSTAVNGGGDGGIQLVDLALSKVGPSTATQGDVVHYELGITNLGPDNFDSGITVTDQLPKSLYLLGGSVGVEDPPQFDGCFISDPKTNTAECDFEPGGQPWRQGDTVIIDFYVYVTGKGTIANLASVDPVPDERPRSGQQHELDVMNVAAATATTGDVVLTKTVNPLLAQSGDTLTYTITVTNKGSKESSAGRRGRQSRRRHDRRERERHARSVHGARHRLRRLRVHSTCSRASPTRSRTS
jgi:uncharacterized repeat protein (TIGR01451 family)